MLTRVNVPFFRRSRMSFYFQRVRPERHTEALWQLRDIYDV